MFDITRIFQIQLHYIYLIMFAKVYTVIVQARSFHFDLFMLRITLLIIHCAAIFIQKLHAKTKKTELRMIYEKCLLTESQ